MRPRSLRGHPLKLYLCSMPRHRSKVFVYLGALLAASCILSVARSQTPTSASDAKPYTLNVAVDEVSLTFHATDFHGIPIDDLKLSDLRLLDNNKRPPQILSFEVHQNLPVHYGILIDPSRSMHGQLPGSQALANEHIAHNRRKQTDRAFGMGYDF